MSYYEYNDLFTACQDTAPYHMYVYDMVNSKQMKDRNRQQQLFNFINTIYQKIQMLELSRNIKILHTNPLFENSDIAYLQDPFLIDGDTIGFTILRDTIPTNEINELFYQVKEELNIPYEFHSADGYYETDLYEEGKDKYFRGYCIQYLNTLHKKQKNYK